MKKKEIYQAPAMEVVELKEKICLQVVSGINPGGEGSNMGWG